MCQNAKEAFERKSWLHGVVGGGRHTPPGGIFFFFFWSEEKKNHLSFFLFKNCRSGTGRLCKAPPESRALLAFAG